jgi:hypothetical protein
VESALTPELLWKMEERGLGMERLADMSAAEIGAFLRHPAAGEWAWCWGPGGWQRIWRLCGLAGVCSQRSSRTEASCAL